MIRHKELPRTESDAVHYLHTILYESTPTTHGDIGLND